MGAAEEFNESYRQTEDNLDEFSDDEDSDLD